METQKKEAATAAKEKVTLINHDQILAILKQRQGETPTKHFAEQLKVVSHQFLSKVLSGDYFIGPKLAKAIGFEQVVRFRPLNGVTAPSVPFSKADIHKAVESLKHADVRPRKAKASKKAKPHHVPPVKAKPIKKAKAIRKKK